MLLSANGLSLPCGLLNVSWGKYAGTTFKFDTLKSDLRALAERLCQGNSGYFGTTSPVALSLEGLSLELGEPLTLNTIFLTQLDGGRTLTEALVAKAPKNRDQYRISIPCFTGRMYSTWATDYFSAYVSYLVAKKAASTSSNPQFQIREQRTLQLVSELEAHSGTPFMVTRLWTRDVGGLRISTPGYRWGGAGAVEFPLGAITASITNQLTTGLPPEAVSEVKPMIESVVATSSASSRFGVNIETINARTLSPSEKSALIYHAGFFAAQPLVLLDVIGAPSGVIDLGQLHEYTLHAVAKFIEGSGQDFLIETETTPRSIGQLMFLMTGKSDAAFYDSIDAIYRRKELPIIPGTVSSAVAAALMRTHPLLVADVTSISGRTITLSTGESLTYPDPMGTGYTLSPSGDRAEAIAALETFNAAVDAAFSLFTDSAAVSPYLLRVIGIPGLTRGVVFSVPAK